MIDNRAFEVHAVTQENNDYSIVGRAFFPLKVGDKLIIGNQSLNEFCLLVLQGIVMYGRELESVGNGYACLLRVEVEGECLVDFTQIRYLYKSQQDERGIVPTDPDYLDETVTYAFHNIIFYSLESGYRISGGTYHRIKIGDKLSIKNNPQADDPMLIVKDILTTIQTSDYHVTEIERGLPATLIVEKTGDVDLINNRYLYKVEEQ